jgi:glycosyltransferase involved in cell wall biosynthesis
LSPPRVLVLHNRYRQAGGEERAVELHLRALERAGVPHGALVRDSGEAGRGEAGAALLRGGARPEEVGDAVRALGAAVVHAHNVLPLLGARALRAAREAGARVVLQLHNFRWSCAIAVAFRDGAPCFRCRRRITVPGLVLNCRGSLSEAAAYATALALHQPALAAAVDAFVSPSEYAAGQLARLGVPAERLHVLPHYLPEDRRAARSLADGGRYALVAARLAPEKGVADAVAAAARAGVPLKVAGGGPLLADLAAGAPRGVELLGPVEPGAVRGLVAGAAMVVVPSVGNETFGYAALEAMGLGVPVVATRSGALPEVVGGARCVPRGDRDAMAAAMRRLWDDAAGRREEGEALLARARERFGEEAFTRRLLGLYADIVDPVE